jgi:hypothetical protein
MQKKANKGGFVVYARYQKKPAKNGSTRGGAAR